MKKSSILIILLALVAFGSTAWAQEVHVDTENELREAISQQPGGTTIILEDNINIESDQLVFNKNFSLDLNGRTLTANYNIRVVSPWTLQIKDNSTTGSGIIKGRYQGGDG